jgi:hypothetical protein
LGVKVPSKVAISRSFIKKDDKNKSTICDLATWCENLDEDDNTGLERYSGLNDVI